MSQKIKALTSFFLWRCGPTRAMSSTFLRFPDHTQRLITVGKTPLDEWWARRRDLWQNISLTTDSYPCPHPSPGEVRTHDLSRRAAADPRLRPRATGTGYAITFYKPFRSADAIQLHQEIIQMCVNIPIGRKCKLNYTFTVTFCLHELGFPVAQGQNATPPPPLRLPY